MAAALSLILLVLLAWSSLGRLPAGADGHMPLPFLISLVRFLWMPTVLVTLIAALSRHWAPMVLGIGLLVLLDASAWPYYRHILGASRHRSSPPDTPPDASTIHVMTLNCRYGHADAAQIVRVVTDLDIDVLALQELSDDILRRLSHAGLDDRLPYRQLGTPSDRDNGGFNGIWTRRRPQQTTASAITIAAAEVPAISLALGAHALGASDCHTVVLASAHPRSPMRGCRDWSSGILALAGLLNPHEISPGGPARRTPSTTPSTKTPSMETASATHATVVMGDLNSNNDHPSFRALLRAGFHDAGLEQGLGPMHTFPTWLRWPGLDLDHVLVTDGMLADDLRAIRIAGSDHLALTATLRDAASVHGTRGASQ